MPHEANGHAGPVHVDPHGLYTLESATRLVALPLGLAEGTLARAVRKGQLRAARRGGRYVIAGSSLLEWAGARRGAKEREGAPA